MGSRNLDRLDMSEWRHHGETIADMWRNNWQVRAYCETCTIELKVDLEVLIRVHGPGLSLWNRTTACRKVGCPGRVFFRANPPGAGGFMPVGKRVPRMRSTLPNPHGFGEPGPLIDPPSED